MDTALSTLSYLPETREQQHTFAHKAIEELMNGDHDLLKVWQQMSIIADTLNEIKESATLKAVVISEIEKYGKEGVSVNGCKLTKGSRRTFDFSECNHARYNELKQVTEYAKAEMKDIETLLKALKESVADASTGELINPATSTVTEFIVVK